MLVISLILLFILDKAIDAYTRHGQAVVMPRLIGVDASLAIQKLEAIGLVGVVNDTLFVEDGIPGSVCQQDPAENSQVKEGRTIYLSIVSSEVPMVRLPNLIDVSLRKATMDLQRLGLQVGDITTRPDIAHNVVLEMRLQGKSVNSGTLVQKGTHIDLEVGMSVPDSLILVPDLTGLDLDEVRMLLHENGLFVGQITEETTISPGSRAFVVRQSPPANTDELIRTLSPVDVWIAPE
jgi:beta-lactam-binding protein with PASTA domain